MTVILAPEWGGSTVAGLVADALAVSQAIAAHRNAREAGLADLAAGLLSVPDEPLSRVLAALHVDRAGLISDLAGTAESRTAPASGPPGVAPGVLTMTVRAPLWRGDSDDEAVGLRLLGELAGAPAPGLQPLRDAGISMDRLRWAAARCGISYAAPGAHSEPLQPPPTPRLEDLRERTPLRRSAAVASVMRKVMPGKDTAGTPYGLVLARRWSLAHITYLCFRPLTILAMAAFGIRTHSWWCVSAVLLLPSSPETVPLTLSIMFYTGLTAVVGLTFPWPFVALVLITAASDGISFRYLWWMKRVDEGDPSLPPAALRRATMQQVDHVVAAWRLERANGR
jgi:hypothetical protein